MENRYDKYKDSGIAWIGEIPEHWKICKLKNIFLLSTGTTPKEYDKISEGDNLINWYTPSDILDGCNDLFSSQRKLSEKVIYENKISLFPIGTLLYVGIGASAGKVGYANENGYSNQQITGLIPIGCYSRFYFYYLSVLKNKIRDNAFFTTLPIINNVYLGQELIPYTLLSEQQSIATYLDQKCSEIDELIALQEEMITKLQSYKQSVITEAVTKGLDKNVTLKDSGIEWIGEIPEHWEINKLFRVCELKARVGWKGLQSSEFEEKSYAYLVTGQDFRGPHINWSICYQINKERYDEDPYIQLKNDDLLITKDGTIGKVAIVSNLDKPACLNSGIFVMRKRNNGFIIKYMYWLFVSSLLKSYNDDINSGASTIMHLYQKIFYQMPLPIPPLSEQQSIADYLDQKCSEIDELISIKQQKIEKLKDYKKSLIFECVTGKRKVS